VGAALPSPFRMPQRPPPRPWIHVLLGNPGETATVRLATPLRFTSLPVMRCPTPVTMSPAAAVEAAFAPPPAQVVEVTASTEAHPQTATGFGPPVPAAAGHDPPFCLEHMELQEGDAHNMSTSSEDDRVPARGSVPSATDTTSHARPTLHPRDVVLAASSVFSCEDAQSLVPTILRKFATNMSAAELSERLEWLWLMRRDVATRAHDAALRGRLLWQLDEHTLSELIRLLEMFAADFE